MAELLGRGVEDSTPASQLSHGAPRMDRAQLETKGNVDDTDYARGRKWDESRARPAPGDPSDPEAEPDSAGGAVIDLRTFKEIIHAVIEEYFVSGDLAELAEAVEELDAPQYGDELVKRAIRVSLDATDRERALVSHLLSAGSLPSVNSSRIKAAFESLLAQSADLRLDCPHSDQQLACFLARAVIDDVIPPSFISDRISDADAPGHHILEQAVVLLSVKRSGAVLEHIWAIGPDAPLDDLEESITLLVKEYLSSLDVVEATACVKELNVPHFHHELVRRGCEIAMDKDERACSALSTLLCFLYYQRVVSPKQLFMGFQRVVSCLRDLELDIPNARELFVGLVNRAAADGVVSQHHAERLHSQLS